MTVSTSVSIIDFGYGASMVTESNYPSTSSGKIVSIYEEGFCQEKATLEIQLAKKYKLQFRK